MNFSVLMSVYKNDNPVYFERALNSIYEEQTLKPNQIVLVLDGDIPKVLEKVIDKFKVSNSGILTIVPLEKNVGLGEALRIGTDFCEHTYICRMDSDDISNPLRFEKQIKYMENNKEIDVVGSNILEFVNDLNDSQPKMLRQVPNSNTEILNFAKKRNPMNHVTVCMRKESLIESGGYESCLLLEDYYLWLKMLASGKKMVNVNEPLVYVRLGDNFISKRSSTTRIVGWGTLQKFMIHKKMINHFEALKNMIYILGFVFTPNMIKKFLYRNYLRKSLN